MVRALDDVPGMRAVLCLFEGVCTGAADGYARMADKPGLTLLHLGPGFANGIAYLHDARRARSPIVNIVGDHATWHMAADAPLTSDIDSLARPVSAWIRRNDAANALARDAADAVAAASTLPGRIATLIVPHDRQLETASGAAAVAAIGAAAGGQRRNDRESDGAAARRRTGRALSRRPWVAGARAAGRGAHCGRDGLLADVRDVPDALGTRRRHAGRSSACPTSPIKASPRCRDSDRSCSPGRARRCRSSAIPAFRAT